MTPSQAAIWFWSYLAYLAMGIVVYIILYRANWGQLRDYTKVIGFEITVVLFWPLFLNNYLWLLWGKKDKNKDKETDS